MSNRIQRGDRLYLVPNRPTAPTIAYQQPQCTVTALAGCRAEIALENGHRLWTATANLRLRPIGETPPPPPTPARPPEPVLAANEHQPTLWEACS